MVNRKSVIVTCLFLSVVFFATGTFAYFRNSVLGTVNANTGELVLEINDKSSSETLKITLTNQDGSKLKPGDRGSFNLALDATGSSLGVSVLLKILRTNLPDNLKFYLDSEYSEEFMYKQYNIAKAASMVENVTLYWYWEDLEESNDNDFMFTEIVATLNAEISYESEPVYLYNYLFSLTSTLDTNVIFRNGASSSNGEGLMKMNSTTSDTYPILYYRGDVVNNNVIFANKCWLIVRTTETGGTKLIYNGEVNDDLTCNNYSGVGGEEANTSYTDVYAGNTETEFNTNNDSPVYVGYMHNDTNKYFASSTLDVSGYNLHLANNTIDSETGHYIQNKTNSTIKEVIDAWYISNIDGKSSESLLEDTVWCNDRSVTSETYSIANYSVNNYFYFSSYTRLAETGDSTPSLTCLRDVDKFTVESTNGNGDLTYPIGLLIADEMNMAGNTNYAGNTVTTYLTIPEGYYWSMSPYSFNYGVAREYRIRLGGELGVSNVDGNDGGARPSVSLSNNAKILDGDGSFENPYLIG